MAVIKKYKSAKKSDPKLVTKKGLYQRVKTAKFRKISSTNWLQRQLNDPYVQAAKADGYRSRAAYKLLQLDAKYHFLRSGINAIDLGAAPGSWSQILVNRLGKNKVTALDILPIDPIKGVHIITQDCMSEAAWYEIEKIHAHQKVELILSDMAAPTIGHPQTDQLRTLALAEMAYEFAKAHLAQGGSFICKIFQGGAGKELLDQLHKDFTKCYHFKPEASRKQSPESYLVALNYRG